MEDCVKKVLYFAIFYLLRYRCIYSEEYILDFYLLRYNHCSLFPFRFETVRDVWEVELGEALPQKDCSSFAVSPTLSLLHPRRNLCSFRQILVHLVKQDGVSRVLLNEILLTSSWTCPMWET